MARPLEYIIVGIEGNDFSGQIATELAAVIESGLVRLVDLVFISKGEDDDVVVMEVDEHEQLSMFAALDGEVGGIIGPEDIDHAAAAVEGGTSAMLVIWENLWAAPLAAAIEGTGGFLIEGGRIPAELTEHVETALASAG